MRVLMTFPAQHQEVPRRVELAPLAIYDMMRLGIGFVIATFALAPGSFPSLRN
jgi:hypothetical protein